MFKKHISRLFLYSAIFLFSLLFPFSLTNAQQTTPEKERYGGTLRVAVPNDFKSLDARYLGQSGSSIRGQQHLYNRLVEYGPRGTQDSIPGLATDWKRTDDVTWLVHLRQGVKFHNGKEMTAYDVAKNYDWRVNGEKYTKEKGWRPCRGRNHYSQIKSVEAVDKYTLKFTQKFPFAPFVGMNLGWGTRGIIDPDIVEKYDKQATLYPVGTGPFRSFEYVSGSHLILERFDDYWGGKTYLDRVILRIIPDAQTRLIALQKGEVDIATDLLFSQVSEVKKDPNLRYYSIAEARRGRQAVWFNFRRWPMNQLRFRQAIAMGVDWERIIKAVFPKGTENITRTLFQGSWLENPEAKTLIPPYNPQKAKQLLKELEKEAGKSIPKIYALAPSGYQQNIPANILRIAVTQLKQIGLNTDLYILPEEIRKDKMRRDPKCEWDFCINAYAGPAIDPGETITDFYSQTPVAGDGKNISGYENSKLDELYKKGGAVHNQEERKKIYQELEKMILKDMVILPVFAIPTIFAYNKKVHDFPAHDSLHIFFRTTWNNVWLEKK